MYHFRRRFLFGFYEFITDTRVFFRKDKHLTGQAVTRGSYFQAVSRYPGDIDSGLPAAAAKACAHRNQFQHIRRKFRLRHAGRYGCLQENELAFACQTVSLAVAAPYLLRASAARRG